MDAVVIRKGKRETIKGISLPEARPLRRGAVPLPGRLILPGRLVVVPPLTVCR
jgi:hypothetical protein